MTHRLPRPAAAAAVLLAALVAAAGSAGCASRGGAGEVRVLAAASLTEALGELGRRFAGPGRAVLAFGGSSGLARQVNAGAPADVLVSADRASMDAVTSAGNAAGSPVVVARNRLAMAVAAGNPKGLNGLADLARPDVVFVRCADAVPCGRLAVAALDRSGVAVRARSHEENVKAVVAKVALGEADAGIVYATDARAAGDRVETVELGLPDDPALQAEYAAVVTGAARNGEGARAFVGLLTSAEGRAVLAAHGFLVP